MGSRGGQNRLGGRGIGLELTHGAKMLLAERGYDPARGARPLRRAIQRFIEDPLSEKILTGDFAKGDEVEVDVASDGAKLEFRVLTKTT